MTLKSRFDCRFHSFLSIRPDKLINVKISDGVPPMESMLQECVSYFSFTVINYIDTRKLSQKGVGIDDSSQEKLGVRSKMLDDPIFIHTRG